MAPRISKAISKAAMLTLVKGLRAAQARAAVAAKPALLEARNERGRNWLHIACGLNVRMLIEHGASVDARNAAGKSAAEIIARKRDPAYRRLAAQFAALA